MKRTAKIKSRSVIYIILLFSFVIYFLGIWWGLPSLQDWAVDAIDPNDVMTGLEQGFSNGWGSRYPPFHYYILVVLYSYFFLLNHLNLIDIKDSLLLYTILIFMGRLLSVVMGTLTVFFVYLSAKQIFKKNDSTILSAIFSALITALICPSIYYAKTLNLEIPYVFWFSVSLLFYIKALKYHRFIDYLLFFVITIISICTKDQAYGLYILTVPFVIFDYYLWEKKQSNSITLASCLVKPKIIIPFLAGIFLFSLIYNFPFNIEGFLIHIKELDDASYNSSNFLNRPENNLEQHLNLSFHCLKDIQFSFSWPIFIICFLGLIAAIFNWKKNHLLICVLIPGISYYLFFLNFILYSRDRFLIPICIILSFFGGKFIADILNYLHEPRIKKVAIAAITVVFVYTFCYSFSVNILMLQDSRYYAENWMKNNFIKNANIAVVGSQVYQPRFEAVKASSVKSISAKELPAVLATETFDYILVSSSYNIDRFPPETEEYQGFRELAAEKSRYRLVFQHKSEPKWNFIELQKFSYAEFYDPRFKTSNLNKINPEIKIFILDKKQKKYIQ